MLLTWQLDTAARKALETERSANACWSPTTTTTITDIVAGYRSQNDVESGFRQLKDPRVVGFSPMFHWTEPKIRVHVFNCALALAVAHLMRRQAHQTDPEPNASSPRPHPEAPVRTLQPPHLRPPRLNR